LKQFRPSPYAKRWWTTELTQLRRMYTYHRNRAKTQHRGDGILPELEQQAKDVAKGYHDAIRKQKKTHWNDFLADDANIWQAARYLNPNGSSAFDKIPSLKRVGRSVTECKPEQASELLLSFYLGGRSPSDTEPWTPSMDGVRATVQYAISTGRLEAEMEQPRGSHNDNDRNPSHIPTIPHHAPSCREQDPASIADDRTLNTLEEWTPRLTRTVIAFIWKHWNRHFV
jgi:hypothetical protein